MLQTVLSPKYQSCFSLWVGYDKSCDVMLRWSYYKSGKYESLVTFQ